MRVHVRRAGSPFLLLFILTITHQFLLTTATEPWEFKSPPSTTTEMGPCNSTHDPAGEIFNCECFEVPEVWKYRSPGWRSIAFRVTKINVFTEFCKMVSGPEFEYGHGSANSSVVAQAGEHRLTVKYNRFAEKCKESKKLTQNECEEDLAKAVNCDDERMGGVGRGNCLTFELKYFTDPKENHR